MKRDLMVFAVWWAWGVTVGLSIAQCLTNDEALSWALLLAMFIALIFQAAIALLFVREMKK